MGLPAQPMNGSPRQYRSLPFVCNWAVEFHAAMSVLCCGRIRHSRPLKTTYSPSREARSSRSSG